MKDTSVESIIYIIKDLLYGPGGDPMDENLRSSAILLTILKDEDKIHLVSNEDLQEFLRVLSEDGNACNENYVTEFKLNDLIK